VGNQQIAFIKEMLSAEHNLSSGWFDLSCSNALGHH